MNELFNCSSEEDLNIFLKKNNQDINQKNNKKINIDNIRNLQGNTPLHTFVLQNKINILKLVLLNKNFVYNINSVNYLGDTPLHLSTNDEISSLLLKYGANPFIPNNNKKFSYYKVKSIVDKSFIT